MFRTSNAKRPPRDHNLVIDIAPYPGTIVSIEVGLEPEEDFVATFAEARRAFGSELNKRKDEVAKRVRFRK